MCAALRFDISEIRGGRRHSRSRKHTSVGGIDEHAGGWTTFAVEFPENLRLRSECNPPLPLTDVTTVEKVLQRHWR